MNARQPRPVMILAGGTGGHVIPALAVADWLRARGVPVVWMGTRNGIEARLVPAAGIPIEWLEIGGLRGKGWRTRLAMPWRLAHAAWQARGILRRHRPGAVLGMGGFAAGPGGLVARLCGVPLVIHEQNAVAGLTNRVLARLATTVLQAFPGAFGDREGLVTTGNPVRDAIADLPPPAERLADREGPLRVLVIGGSRGARALNRAVPAAVAAMAAGEVPRVRHQAGGDELEATRAAYREHGIAATVEPFFDDMAAAYAWADVAICRAGALTVAELAAAGVPAILVPYPFAVDDHQAANARVLVDAGAGWLVRQSELDPRALAERLDGLAGDRGGLLAMAERARGVAQPDATAEVGRYCLHFIKQQAEEEEGAHG